MTANNKKPASPEKLEFYWQLIADMERLGSIEAVARDRNKARGTIQHQYKMALRETGSPDVRSRHIVRHDANLSDSVKVSGNHSEVTRIVPERVKTLADLIRVCEIDTSEWEVERYICNKWEMGSVPRAIGGTDEGWSRPDARPIVTQLYQVKAWLRRKVAVIAARAELADLLADAKKQIAKRPTLAPKAKSGGHMLEISIPDLHMGKLAWAPETGHQSYDSRIAERLFDTALTALIQRTQSFAFEQIVFVVGNDLLHSDTKQGTTTSGTPLDTDSRFHKSFGIARRMITRAVDTLRHIAPVRVVVVPGNHDTLSAWHLGDSLECYFYKTPDVEIDNAPSMRKYVQFGSVMLLLTHGNRGKREDYPLLMATERPQMFGTTVHREAHTGHLHQLKTSEHHGVRVRISPALCPPDSWHAEHTYVGNARAAEAFVWSKTEGLVCTATYTVQPSDEEDPEKPKGKAA